MAIFAGTILSKAGKGTAYADEVHTRFGADKTAYMWSVVNKGMEGLANELLEAADDEQLAADELISLVLGFAIICTAVQSRLNKALEDRRASAIASAHIRQ